MSTADKTNLKKVLRIECLPALGGQSKYYNTEAVTAWLRRRKLHCPPSINPLIFSRERDDLFALDRQCGLQGPRLEPRYFHDFRRPEILLVNDPAAK